MLFLFLAVGMIITILGIYYIMWIEDDRKHRNMVRYAFRCMHCGKDTPVTIVVRHKVFYAECSKCGFTVHADKNLAGELDTSPAGVYALKRKWYTYQYISKNPKRF